MSRNSQARFNVESRKPFAAWDIRRFPPVAEVVRQMLQLVRSQHGIDWIPSQSQGDPTECSGISQRDPSATDGISHGWFWDRSGIVLRNSFRSWDRRKHNFSFQDLKSWRCLTEA